MAPDSLLDRSLEAKTLIEEVEGELRCAEAWMSEAGIARRCKLASDPAEVTAALAELERIGVAISQNRDTRMPIWRLAKGKGLPEAPKDPPEPNYNTAPRVIGQKPARESRMFTITPHRPGQTPREIAAHIAAANRRAHELQRIPTPKPPALPASSQDIPMSKKETMRQRVQEALAGEPLKVGVLAAKLKSSGPTIRYHLLALAKDGLVRQLEPGNRMSAWTSGDGTAPAESRKPGKRVNGARRLPKGGAVQDYQLKIIVLDEVIKEADGSELRAAALRAIRADLQRLAA